MSPNSLILGGLCLGSTLGREESLEFLNKAYKLGIRDIDTGSLYGNGMSEKFICEYQKKSKNNFKIHTKIGLAKDIRKDGTFGVKLEDLSYDYIIESTINALTRLEVEKIHRVSLHAFCKNVPVKEQLRSLNYLVSKGFIESYGICNFESNELKHWINECIEYSSFLPSSLDVHFNLLEQRAAFDLFPLLQKNGIEAIPYRVFCRGLLSDRYDNHK
jgi:aryl-alcohol dehydrogenase-like predicted oxidoreductase